MEMLIGKVLIEYGLDAEDNEPQIEVSIGDGNGDELDPITALGILRLAQVHYETSLTHACDCDEGEENY